MGLSKDEREPIAKLCGPSQILRLDEGFACDCFRSFSSSEGPLCEVQRRRGLSEPTFGFGCVRVRAYLCAFVFVPRNHSLAWARGIRVSERVGKTASAHRSDMIQQNRGKVSEQSQQN